MAYTTVPTVVDGDDLTDDFTLAVKAGIDELQVSVPQASTLFTPTWGSVTVGNGTNTGRYVKAGGMVTVSIGLTFGTTTAITGSVSVNLPFAVVGTTSLNTVYLDSGTTWYHGFHILNTSTNIGLSSGLSLTAVTSTSPFTWTTSDAIFVSGSYLFA
jgi:hypothetical protein